MPTHTINLNNRLPTNVVLTVEEADELAAKGFRFSVYRPTIGEFRLSFPVETSHVPSDCTLTFRQADKENG